MTTSILAPVKPTKQTNTAPISGNITIRVRVAESLQDLDEHVTAWDDLAAQASEPNVFFESWVIRPGIPAFEEGQNLFYLFVYAESADNAKQPPVLIGFFPMNRRRRYRGLPISCVGIWQHGEAFLATPLIRKDYENECFRGFFQWLKEDPRSAPLVEFPQLSGDGPVYKNLVHHFFFEGTLHYPVEAFNRAFLIPSRLPMDDYPATISANKRRDLKRKQRRLEAMGQLNYRQLEDEADVDEWLDKFLQLEASGWKGRENTALLCKERNHIFFREMAREAFRRDQLLMLGLFLDDKPVAIRCNFVSGEGSFFFKPAYDETLAKFSPGVLLELEMIRYLQDHPQIAWMDSCTSPNNQLLNGLWCDRRTIHTIVAATGKRFGGLVVSMLPMLRWVNRKFGKYDPTEV